MNALLLIIITIGLVVQNITKKEFDKKMSGGAICFSAGSVAAALLFFVVASKGKFEISAESAIYASLFAVVYTTATITTFLAIKTGPLSLTALISSYSLIIPTIFGMTALGEEVTPLLIVGIALLLISLVFVNFEKKGEQKKITAKWLVYVGISFVSNGMCSVVQRIQQIEANGLYKNEFMIVALAISVVCLVISMLIFERKQAAEALKKGAVLYTLCGISNGIVNLLVMVLALKMSASVTFPVISGGSIVLTVLIAWLCYKERLSKSQIAGVILGVTSIVFLNI